MRWFRFYDDAINDPKVLRMPEVLRWHWVALLCIASKNDGRIPCIEDVALMLRKTVSEAQGIVGDLIQRGLIDETHGHARTPHNWRKRQYKSDVSTARVKLFRKRFKSVSETPPDTDTDTDTEQNKKKEAPASRGAALPEGWHPSDDDFSYVEKLGLSRSQALEGLEEMRLWAGANSNRSVGRKANWSLAYRSWIRRNKKGGSSRGQTAPNGLSQALARLGDHIGETERGEEGSQEAARLLSFRGRQ